MLAKRFLLTIKAGLRELQQGSQTSELNAQIPDILRGWRRRRKGRLKCEQFLDLGIQQDHRRWIPRFFRGCLGKYCCQFGIVGLQQFQAASKFAFHFRRQMPAPGDPGRQTQQFAGRSFFEFQLQFADRNAGQSAPDRSLIQRHLDGGAAGCQQLRRRS